MLATASLISGMPTSEDAPCTKNWQKNSTVSEGHKYQTELFLPSKHMNSFLPR
jgi:hypothetical protein